MKDFYDLALSRESCRNFIAGKEVEKEKLEKLIEAARIAPSARNSQPWDFIVVNDLKAAEEVAKCMQDEGMNKFLSDTPAFIVAVERDLDPENPNRNNEKQYYAKFDIGIATAHICLQAAELGLSTCIIGWINQIKLKHLLNIKSPYGAAAVIAVGYGADAKPRPKKRRAFSETAVFVQ